MRCCEQLSTKLPDSWTCGALCTEFPTCLRRPSNLRLQPDDTEAIAESLRVILEAIVKGLGEAGGRSQ
jgi:hypothetical protein